MKGAPIQQMFQQVVTLVFIVRRLWCPIPGGAAARDQPASNPRNGPFRPTSAASSARDSPASSRTSSSQSKKDFKFKDALFASSSKRTRSRSPRPSMSRRSATLPQQDISISRLQSGTLSRRWMASTRPNSRPGEASHSAALRRRGDQPTKTQGIRLASSNSLPATSHSISSLLSEAKQTYPIDPKDKTENSTPCDRANLRDKAYVQGSNPPARSIQAPLGHRRQQGWRARHNRRRGGRSSRAHRAARKAACAHTDIEVACSNKDFVVGKDCGYGAGIIATSNNDDGNSRATSRCMEVNHAAGEGCWHAQP
jgi:hypothetical protein